MKKFNPSPAPWSEFQDSDSHDIVDAEGFHVASVEPCNDSDPAGRQESNALLLAAAPALLARLIDALALLDHYTSGRPNNWDGSTRTQALATLRQGRALLATLKAEG